MTEDETPPAEPNDEDAEIGAIVAVMQLLKPFEPPAKRRVIGFVADRIGLQLATSAAPAVAGGERGVESRGDSPVPTYVHFAELTNRIRPTSDIDRVLTASYWVQVVKGTSPFGSTEVNALLKEISAGVGHVAEAMTALQQRSPALIIHLKKSGSSRQARKTYLVTPEGIDAVQAAIRAGRFVPIAKDKGRSS